MYTITKHKRELIYIYKVLNNIIVFPLGFSLRKIRYEGKTHISLIK